MSIGLYPGSFNPWHIGHQDVLDKACKVFDMVFVLVCESPEKSVQGAERRAAQSRR